MLNLRDKAHASLSQFRNTPPRHASLSEPSTPADDNDELSFLGGRTRLVAQKEKSLSPVLGNFSPVSSNPIVPFPIKQDLDAQTHPVVLEYLRSFNQHPQTHPRPQQQPSQSQLPSPFEHTSFSEMTPLSSSSSNFSPNPVFSASQQLSPLTMTQQSLPQYFPVFDYGYADNGSGFPTVIGADGDVNGRYSPEGTMQTAWQDFVAQIEHVGY